MFVVDLLKSPDLSQISRGWLRINVHGCDIEASFPERGTLVKLGLACVADDLEKMGKLR